MREEMKRSRKAATQAKGSLSDIFCTCRSESRELKMRDGLGERSGKERERVRGH